MVTSSADKHESHRRINSFLEPWIKYYFFDPTAMVITMPANSGRQERMLLSYIYSLEDKLGDEGQIGLYTCDRDYDALTCGIAKFFEDMGICPVHSNKYWHHSVRDCVMDAIGTLDKGPKAVWLDLTGGLTDKTRNKIQRAVKTFSHGSLLFTTLQVHGVRSLTDNEYARKVYSATSDTVEGKVIITDSLLKETVSSNDNQYLRTMVAPQVYQHNTTTYAVYFHIVGEYGK
jgi:hypothetical protein